MCESDKAKLRQLQHQRMCNCSSWPCIIGDVGLEAGRRGCTRPLRVVSRTCVCLTAALSDAKERTLLLTRCLIVCSDAQRRRSLSCVPVHCHSGRSKLQAPCVLGLLRAGTLMSDTGGAMLLRALEACPWQPRDLDLSGNTACAALFATALARCLQCASLRLHRPPSPELLGLP